MENNHSLTTCILVRSHKIVCSARHTNPAIGRKIKKDKIILPNGCLASVPMDRYMPRILMSLRLRVDQIAILQMMLSGNNNKIPTFLNIVLTINFIFLSSFNHCFSGFKTVSGGVF